MKESVFIPRLLCDLLGSDKSRASKKPKRHGRKVGFFFNRERFKPYLFEKRTEKNRRFYMGH